MHFLILIRSQIDKFYLSGTLSHQLSPPRRGRKENLEEKTGWLTLRKLEDFLFG